MSLKCVPPIGRQPIRRRLEPSSFSHAEKESPAALRKKEISVLIILSDRIFRKHPIANSRTTESANNRLRLYLTGGRREAKD